jgi:hypothetical protein
VAAAVAAVDPCVPNGSGRRSVACASMTWASLDMLHAGVRALQLAHLSVSTAQLCHRACGGYHHCALHPALHLLFPWACYVLPCHAVPCYAL